jgi:hypothetical protein
MLDALEHSLIESLKLIPFLFLTYLFMEFLEHRAGDKTEKFIRRSGKLGPLVGALLGAVPQCGFSAAAAGLYSGRVISVGTLLAIFLSTSDEMLPILVSGNAGAVKILKILGIKIVIGALVGFVADAVIGVAFKKKEHVHIGEICEDEHCHCEKGILRGAISHTLKIAVFVFIISFALHFGIHAIGEDKIAAFIMSKPILSNVLAGIIGLIPNCAASVAISTLYLDGLISAGAMLSGLLVGAGVGVLVLFRVNDKLKNSIFILFSLFLAGTLFGILFDLLGLAAIIGI